MNSHPLTLPVQTIVSDLDGTLLDGEHKLTPPLLAKLRRIREHGVKIILASGRPYADVEPIRAELDIDMFLITSNGARVHNKQNQCVMRHDLAPAVVEALIELPVQAHLNIYGHDAWQVCEPKPELLDWHKTSGFAYECMPKSELPREQVAKVFWIGEHEELIRWQPMIEERFAGQVTVTFALPGCMEVMAHGVNKGEALSTVLDSKGIVPEHAVAFGDGLNDQEMLAMVGQAYVMANGNPKLRGIPGAQVIAAHTDFGVLKQLEQLFPEI